MTTIVTHAAVPLLVGAGLGPKIVPPRLLMAGMLASVLPDMDVIAFKFGIAYADILGHRGFSHSLLCALIGALFAASIGRWLSVSPSRALVFVGGALLSHTLLDMLTDGGLGVALLWPWSEARYFAPWRPIKVSPFVNVFFSKRGMDVLLFELRGVWLPLLLVAAGLRLLVNPLQRHCKRGCAIQDFD